MWYFRIVILCVEVWREWDFSIENVLFLIRHVITRHVVFLRFLLFHFFIHSSLPMNDLEVWWNQLPRVTKWLFAGSFGLTIAANLLYRIVPFFHPMNLILDFEMVFTRFQVCRFILEKKRISFHFSHYFSVADMEISYSIFVSWTLGISFPHPHVVFVWIFFVHSIIQSNIHTINCIKFKRKKPTNTMSVV